MSHILAIVGLPGAGKREVAKYIEKKTGWPKIYFGDITAEGLAAQGLALTEENERKFREDIRARHGMAAYALLNLEKIKAVYPSSSLILESFYSWEEYLLMRDQFGDGFKVLAVWAPPDVRQRRMQRRTERPLSAAEFRSRDYSQIENLHQAGPVARADFMLINNSTLSELQLQIDVVLEQL